MARQRRESSDEGGQTESGGTASLVSVSPPTHPPSLPFPRPRRSRAELLTKQVSELRALIRVVMEGIRDLQNISSEPLPDDDHHNDRAF